MAVIGELQLLVGAFNTDETDSINTTTQHKRGILKISTMWNGATYYRLCISHSHTLQTQSVCSVSLSQESREVLFRIRQALPLLLELAPLYRPALVEADLTCLSLLFSKWAALWRWDNKHTQTGMQVGVQILSQRGGGSKGARTHTHTHTHTVVEQKDSQPGCMYSCCRERKKTKTLSIGYLSWSPHTTLGEWFHWAGKVQMVQHLQCVYRKCCQKYRLSLWLGRLHLL